MLATVLVAHAPLLDDLWRLVRMREVSSSAVDAATHYLRVLHARNLYLPSGHRLGWDPFWFQGYVPFLLYPHLTYVLVALVSLALPVDPPRVFNTYTAVLFLALPLVAALPVLRSRGWLAATVVAAWFAELSTVGAGLTGVFAIGLLTQQAGVCLFVAFTYDLIVSRRIDRAAIWLGLIPLAHVHAALVAAIAWAGAGLLALAHRKDEGRPLRTWLIGSVFAFVISLPTVIALVEGWGQVGVSTSFGTPADLPFRVVAGNAMAPWPIVAAIALCLVTAVVRIPAGERLEWCVWALIGVFYFVVSVEKWRPGVPLLDRVLVTMLFLRTLPFAFAWVAFLAVRAWPRIPAVIRVVVVALTMFGVVKTWPIEALAAKRIGSPWRNGGQKPPPTFVDYRAALDWIAADAHGEISTLAVILPPKTTRGLPLMTAVVRARLPLLGGHGVELTPVHNAELSDHTVTQPCNAVRRAVHDYAVGYLIGSTREQRAHLEKCLNLKPTFQRGSSWVFTTGERWGAIAPGTTRFVHNRTWTELQWDLPALTQQTPMRLPMANTAPWAAEVDGKPVAIGATSDDMMQVTLPEGGRRLRLHYRGYPGEWASIVVSLVALGIAAVRVRRARSTRELTAASARAQAL